MTNKMSSMVLSNNNNNKANGKNNLKGPLDQFLIRKNVKEDSLTMSDFECDSFDLDLSDIINGIIS